MNGAPEKPISGKSSRKARRVCLIASKTILERTHVFYLSQSLNVRSIPDWVVNRGAFAFGKLQVQSHRFNDEQNVGKDDCRIDTETFRGSGRHFCGQCGRFAEFEKLRVRANFAVFRHVSAGLAHQPDGRVRNRLASASAHERAVLQFPIAVAAVGRSRDRASVSPRLPGV